MSRNGPAGQERRHLCDRFAELGPEAPTLCEGWTTHDLAAHLYTRERRPHAALGLVVPALADFTDRVQARVKGIDYDVLVERLRKGPPLPAVPVDDLVNLHEYFVHHEDVRRAQPGWDRRDDPRLDRALWKLLRRSARILTRRLKNVGLVLERPDGETIEVRDGTPTATLKGGPQELLLYIFGRRDVAEVSVEGTDEAVAVVEAADLGV